jgi:hypothetical protein
MRNPQTNRNRYSDVITTVINQQGQLQEIYYHINTGRIAARADTKEASGYHSGIVLGTDKYGSYWIAHNHYQNKKPLIVSAHQFCKGNDLCFEVRDTRFNNLKIAARAIRQVMKGKAYHGLVYDSDDFITASITDTYPVAMKTLSESAVLLGVLSAFLRIIE